MTGFRVAVASYPTLFQTAGGLAMKVRATVEALNDIGIPAHLINLLDESIGDFDLLHVFAAFNGNQRLVESAVGQRRPVVISPILTQRLSTWELAWARVLSGVTFRITGWTVQTTYNQVIQALDGSDRILALGRTEWENIVRSYRQPAEKMCIVPNGVGRRFFEATPDLFNARHDVQRPMVLHVGMIGDVKNQLGLVRALRGTGVELVLVGPCAATDRHYLSQCLSEGEGRVRYLGAFAHNDPLLESAYAAADVVAVPSLYEGMPNFALEALASGTPVVMTSNHSFDYERNDRVVREVSPFDRQSIGNAVLALIEEHPSPQECRHIVRDLSWDAVARRLASIYSEVLASSTLRFQRRDR